MSTASSGLEHDGLLRVLHDACQAAWVALSANGGRQRLGGDDGEASSGTAPTCGLQAIPLQATNTSERWHLLSRRPMDALRTLSKILDSDSTSLAVKGSAIAVEV
jgi:hypothetical protein